MCLTPKAIAFELWINISMGHWTMSALESSCSHREDESGGHFGNYILFCSVSFLVRTGKIRNELMKRERPRECTMIIAF